MTETEASLFFKALDLGVEYKMAYQAAKFRIRTLGSDPDCKLSGETPTDIAWAVLLRIEADPNKMLNKPQHLTLAGFRKRVSGMINNHIAKLRQSAKVTINYDATEVIPDEVFFDTLVANAESEELSIQHKEEAKVFFDEIGEEFLDKGDEDAWLVLQGIIEDKKPQDIASDNNWPINHVRNAVKRVMRAIRTKQKVPIR